MFFTHLNGFAPGKLGDPTIVTGGTLIVGFAALYCVNIGYERTEVADAIASQARRLFSAIQKVFRKYDVVLIANEVVFCFSG